MALFNLRCFIFLIFLPSALLANEQAFNIVQKSDQKMRGDASYSESTMHIIRPDWTRSMSIKSWTKGTELSLVLITAPAKDKGNAFLKRKNEMWNWIANIERIIKISPSMLGQSWLGSDFTNDDLLNQSSIVVDYEHQLISEQQIEADNCYTIDAIAKPNAPVVWSRIRLWISTETYLQRKVEFYDEFGDLINTLQTFDIKKLGGREIATRMQMIPADKAQQKTEIITHQAQFDFAISDNFFSQSQMKALRD